MKKILTICGCIILILVLGIGTYLGSVYSKMTKDSPDIVDKPDGFGEGQIEQDTGIAIDPRTDDEVDDAADDPDSEDEDIEIKDDEDDIYQMEQIDENVINILLCGCDAGSETRSRSDSMLIASFDREKKTLKMVSLLRDTWVPIEGLGYNRLNASHSYGGVGCTVNTINNVFHMDLQQYVEIGFEGFEKLIDEIGGVDVELYTAEAKKLGVGETDGVYHLDGINALSYVRERHIGRADFERTERQRKVIDATLKKIRNEFDKKSIYTLIKFAMGYVRTNMSEGTIATLAFELFSSDVEFESCCMPFNGTWNFAMIEKKSVITIDYEANEEKMKEFLYK